MAESGNPAELNLEQILATLANLPQTTTPPVPAQQQFHAPSQNPAQTDGFPTSQYIPQSGFPYQQGQAHDPRLTGRPTIPSRPQTQQQALQSRTTTPAIDPATITEWKHGLRCVNKTATQNPAFVPAIQKLIADQARNVKDWESGRQRLITEQVAKRENEQENLALLSLPGMSEHITPLRTDEVEKEELVQYDKKVYRACQSMVEAQTASLKGLGVPFFGTRPDLMRSEGGEFEVKGGPGAKKVTKMELLELQRKMLNHLMELYGD